jgi:hypothetical protein
LGVAQVVFGGNSSIPKDFKAICRPSLVNTSVAAGLPFLPLTLSISVVVSRSSRAWSSRSAQYEPCL